MKKQGGFLRILLVLFLAVQLAGCSGTVSVQQETVSSALAADENTADEVQTETPQPAENGSVDAVSSENIPVYSGAPYVAVNGNVPYFSDSDLTEEAFESYSELDSLGRCGTAYANVCTEIMPTEKRGAIGSVKPTGWHTVKYDSVDGKYLYNRCHLIGYQLSAENANPKNLITGTRYLNVQGMLPFENMVADYVKETEHHVLYRVTPIFAGDNLLASGVLMEAESVEDKGEGIQFCVYCYNVQPGISINYADGSSSEGGDDAAAAAATPTPTAAPTSVPTAAPEEAAADAGDGTMVWIPASGKRYHRIPDCGSMNPDKAHQETEEEAIAEGYEKCPKCWN